MTNIDPAIVSRCTCPDECLCIGSFCDNDPCQKVAAAVDAASTAAWNEGYRTGYRDGEFAATFLDSTQ